MRVRSYCCSLVVGVLVVSVTGCAARVSPELVAARAVSVLELIQVAQRSLIAAEALGLIDEVTTATSLRRIAEAVQHAQELAPLLRNWDQMSKAAQEGRLTRARIVVFTLSQVLAAIVLPEGQMAPVSKALLGANELLLRISDMRGDL